MIIKHAVSVLFLLFLSCYPAEDSSEVYGSLKTKGYFEVANSLFLREDYDGLYSKFDQFIDLVSSDEELANYLSDAESKFLADSNLKARYCSAPPSYRDPSLHKQKRHSKIYFQFIQEHYESVRESDMTRVPIVASFLEEMFKVDKIAKAQFADVLDKLEPECSGIKSSLFSKYQSLSVITKIVRYNKGNGDSTWGTTPHFDKSALSLIWDSDDDNHDCLLVCENTENPNLDELRQPPRQVAKDGMDATSALLIGGLALPHIGVDIKPTLHGVTVPKNEYRHSIISFALVPDLNMSDWQTDF